MGVGGACACCHPAACAIKDRDKASRKEHANAGWEVGAGKLVANKFLMALASAGAKASAQWALGRFVGRRLKWSCGLFDAHWPGKCWIQTHYTTTNTKQARTKKRDFSTTPFHRFGHELLCKKSSWFLLQFPWQWSINSAVTAVDRQFMTWVQKRAFYASTSVGSGKSRFWACKVPVTWHLIILCILKGMQHAHI